MTQLRLVPNEDAFRCVFYNERMRHVRGFSFFIQRQPNGLPNCTGATQYAEEQCKKNGYSLLTLNFDRRR